MPSLCTRVRFFRSAVWRWALIFTFLISLSTLLQGQSTFGSILGTVRDSTGAVITGAEVTLTSTDNSAVRTLVTDAQGNYAFKNIDVGHYTVTIATPGFEKSSLPEILLTARESRRMDATLQPGSETQTVEVTGQSIPVIATEVSNVAETKVGDELVELPVAIYSRSTGSTSPISTLTTEAGVQTDDSGNLAVMGTTAALLSVTIDGISSVGVEYSGPVNEMFPSFNSIEEIRVSESNNNAEFSGVADITTVSKAGTNHFHGGLFENHENTVLNSGNAFALSKPRIIMNDFGGTLGGPLKLPLLNSEEHPSFFFVSYEGLRLPRQTPLLLSVPSQAMRQGQIGDYLRATYCPTAASCPNGYTVYNPDGSVLTSSTSNAPVAVSDISARLLAKLFPAPNYGPASAFANNYQVNFPSPISANQGDVRLDRTISSRQTVFARFSYKNRQVVTAPSASCTFSYCAEAGSPLLGGFNTPEIDEGMTAAHNFVITPTLLNEFRGGYNEQHTSENQSYRTSDLLASTGLSVPQPDTRWPEAPQVLINGFLSTGAGNPGVQRGQIVQLLDNLTWTRSTHTFKFGVDFKRITDHDENLFGNYRSGWYVFNGSSNVGSTIGDPYTAFLLGYPDTTTVTTTNNATMNGRGHSYAYFAQDDWKITPRLTLNLGMRYELHPPMTDRDSNTAAFLPNWSGTGTDGSTLVHGAVAVPNARALANASTQFENAIAPTRLLTASQAGIPTALRYTDKTGLGPRIGFAWRIFGDDRTVLRGGWGRFLESPLGFQVYAGGAVASSFQGTYQQSLVTGKNGKQAPMISFADPFDKAAASGSGTAGFYYAFPIHYSDPSVEQWNLTFERDLGRGVGARISYTGSHGDNLEAMVDLNQTHPSAKAYDASQSPYPLWSILQSVANTAESNYNSATVEISNHNSKSISFDASYTFTRDLSNAGGATPNAFAVAGGSYLTTRFHPGLDYGNVVYDRRHRLLATYLWQLPFGKNQRWLSHGGMVNAVAGGWQLAGVTVMQSGPFLTPYQQSIDPANTNILTTIGQARTDQVHSVSLYAAHRTTAQWLNPAAFPYSNLGTTDANGNSIGIGRFGNAPVGGVIGPGTANFSLSAMKSVTLTEQAKFQFSVEAANLFNHRNFEPPNMQADSSGFGTITALQTAEGAGPRSLEVSGRITF